MGKTVYLNADVTTIGSGSATPQFELMNDESDAESLAMFSSSAEFRTVEYGLADPVFASEEYGYVIVVRTSLIAAPSASRHIVVFKVELLKGATPVASFFATPLSTAWHSFVYMPTQEEQALITAPDSKRRLIVDFNADDGLGVIKSIQNSEGVDLYITRVVLDIRTASTAASTLDLGTASAAATNGDNLIDPRVEPPPCTAAGFIDKLCKLPDWPRTTSCE